MVTTTTTHIEDVQSMVDTGTAQIAEVQAQIDALDERIRAAESERTATLPPGREGRVIHLREAHATLAQADAAHTQALSYAKLAHETPKEAQAVKDVSTAKKELQTARKEMEQVERDTTDANQRDDAREEALRKEIHLLTFERETHEAEIHEMSKGLNKAQAELGTHTYEALVADYQAHQAHVDALHAQLIAAQVESNDKYESGYAALADFPDLQKAYARQRPPDDATTRVMEATLYYAGALLQDAENVVADLPPTILPDYQGTWHTLTIREQELRDPARLHERIETITRTLDKYRDMLKAQ